MPDVVEIIESKGKKLDRNRCFMSALECAKCGAILNPDEVHQLCACGSPLLVRYDLEKLKMGLNKKDLSVRLPSLWRYREFLPVRRDDNIVTLGEGMTPLVPLPVLGKEIETDCLYVKDEGVLPTGTFKTRGATVGVSRAKELNVNVLAMPTNGNAGGAWATYAARAEIQACIVMPQDAPVITRNECAITGARLFLVKGLISDAGKIVSKAISAHGWYDASTLKEPYRIEGKKTMGLEIAEQFNWKLPDVILYPTGGGVGIIGIYKAFLELKAIGWIDGPLPRLVSVQASGCAPVVKAWEGGKTESEFWDNSKTLAFGINVPKAIGDFLVLDAVNQTNGYAIAVHDHEILKAQKQLAQKEGMFVCPEGAATWAATRKLYERGWIRPGEQVVLLNTGTGLKYPETVRVKVPTLEIDDEIPM